LRLRIGRLNRIGRSSGGSGAGAAGRAQVVDESDLARFAELDVAVCFQPVWGAGGWQLAEWITVGEASSIGWCGRCRDVPDLRPRLRDGDLAIGCCYLAVVPEKIFLHIR
jgi:hypothetical protein